MSNKLEQAAEIFLGLTSRLQRLGQGVPPPKEAQISQSQVILIEYAASKPGCGIQEMAKGLGLATPTVSISVRQLEKAGFIERQPDPQDGRAGRLFLTSAGQKLHQRTHGFRRKKFEGLLAGLTPEERITLLGLLEQAISNAEIKEESRR